MPRRQIRHLLVAISIALPVLASGCGPSIKDEEPVVFFPAPPIAPRVQFLTWASGAGQVEPPTSSFEEFILGDEVSAPRTIVKPYGVAVHEGVVYVCDTKGLNVARLDFKNKSYSTFGGRGPGRLRKPINMIIDPLGYKFVVDPFRKQVVVYGPDDDYVRSFDIPKPCYPVDVALYGNELYVLDNDDTCQIVVLDRSTGKEIRSFGSRGGEPGQFNLPNSLCIDGEGYIYVSDTFNFRIQKLTREGEVVWTKGTAGYRLGEFGRIRGIRVGPDGTVYVVDTGKEHVQMFNSEGQILMRFGGPGTVPGALELPSTLAIDRTSIPYFQEYVHEDFEVDYLLFVASQYGGRLINVYAFGSFPEGYELTESRITTLPPVPRETPSVGPVEAASQPTSEVATSQAAESQAAAEDSENGPSDDGAEEAVGREEPEAEEHE